MITSSYILYTLYLPVYLEKCDDNFLLHSIEHILYLPVYLEKCDDNLLLHTL